MVVGDEAARRVALRSVGDDGQGGPRPDGRWWGRKAKGRAERHQGREIGDRGPGLGEGPVADGGRWQCVFVVNSACAVASARGPGGTPVG
jgi:hypothetical protein